MRNQEEIVGVKELRQNLEQYIAQIAKGKSFMVIRRSKPVFNITPVNSEENWEEAVDFTKIKKGGVKIEGILSFFPSTKRGGARSVVGFKKLKRL